MPANAFSLRIPQWRMDRLFCNKKILQTMLLSTRKVRLSAKYVAFRLSQLSTEKTCSIGERCGYWVIIILNQGFLHGSSTPPLHWTTLILIGTISLVTMFFSPLHIKALLWTYVTNDNILHGRHSLTLSRTETRQKFKVILRVTSLITKKKSWYGKQRYLGTLQIR